MAASVLGKRTRSAIPSAGNKDSKTTTRCTRNSQFVVLDNSEKENPFVTPKKPRTPKHVDLGADELADEDLPAKRMRGSPTVPAKHGAMQGRVALSPAKINSHFKTAKANVSTDAKTSHDATPSTPRHRDACANKVAVTPRHRVSVSSKPLTPRTPRTPTTPRGSATTIYNDARQLFIRGSQPGRLIGREEERDELQQFVASRVGLRKSGCLYISGPPGTGKSALVSEVCQELDDATVKRAYINCMSAKSASELYVKLLEEIGEADDVLEGTEQETLRKIMFRRAVSYVVTLDEVDYLLELDLELLYNIFEWAMRPKSSLILLGIANALDFTDRFLPRLKSRGLKPQLLPFMPYTASQIASVINSKLKGLLPTDTTASADFVPFLHPTAIQFLAKKVAAQTGDLRKAFDICRRAIDMIESDTREQHARKSAEESLDPVATPSKTILIENMNLSSPARTPTKTSRHSAVASSLSKLRMETAPRATIAHMARVTAAVFSNGTTQRLKNLNLQQKAVLCALSALEKKLRDGAAMAPPSTPSRHQSAAAAAPTIKALYDAYANLCKRDNVLHPLTSTEFRDVVASLETLSLISALEGNGKSGSFSVPSTPSKRGGRGGGGFSAGLVEEKRVSSSVSLKELSGALDGPGSSVLRGLLNGEDVA